LVIPTGKEVPFGKLETTSETAQLSWITGDENVTFRKQESASVPRLRLEGQEIRGGLESITSIEKWHPTLKIPSETLKESVWDPTEKFEPLESPRTRDNEALQLSKTCGAAYETEEKQKGSRLDTTRFGGQVIKGGVRSSISTRDEQLATLPRASTPMKGIEYDPIGQKVPFS